MGLKRPWVKTPNPVLSTLVTEMLGRESDSSDTEVRGSVRRLDTNWSLGRRGRKSQIQETE